MSMEMMQRVCRAFKDVEHSYGDQFMLLMLAYHCNKDTMQCNPGQIRLEEEMHMSYDTQKTIRRRLRKRGFLTWKTIYGSTGKQTSNRYTIHFPSEAEKSMLDGVKSRVLTEEGVIQTPPGGCLNHRVGGDTITPNHKENHKHQPLVADADVDKWKKGFETILARAAEACGVKTKKITQRSLKAAISGLSYNRVMSIIDEFAEFRAANGTERLNNPIGLLINNLKSEPRP